MDLARKKMFLFAIPGAPPFPKNPDPEKYIFARRLWRWSIEPDIYGTRKENIPSSLASCKQENSRMQILISRDGEEGVQPQPCRSLVHKMSAPAYCTRITCEISVL